MPGKVRQKLAAVFSSIGFVNECVICGSEASGIPLCPRCYRNLKSENLGCSNSSSLCSLCGKPLVSEQSLCMNCRSASSLLQDFSGVHFSFEYLLKKKALLFHWKIAEERQLTFFFAEVMADLLNKCYPGVTVVAVPPRPHKIRQKGWDQIQDLVYVLRFFYGVRVISPLLRKSDTEQKHLSKEERLGHKGAVYEADSRWLRKNQVPEEVVLLDDVITTGVTMQTCARLLKEIGVKKVFGAALFCVP